MKQILSVLTLLFFLSGCNLEDSVVSPINPEQSGKVLLKFEPSSIPTGITTITAFLTRQGFNPITGNLNLLSDSTAEISFQNIAVGTWHLLVQAKDSVNVVRFSGETDVNVVENIITQVYLTLIPTGAGTGGIHIVVNWGTPIQYQWIDYQYNPILKPSANNFLEARGLSHAKILFEDNTYKMWFTAISFDAKGYVFYATSIDGINWIRSSNLPVLSPSSGDAWDNRTVAAGAIIKEGGVYKMFYSGYSNLTGVYQIGLATSTDGINWVKKPNPILTGSTPWEANMGVTEVIKIANVYYLYYHGHNSTTNYQISIGLATSVDGIQWVKYNGNPILTKTQAWEGSGVLSPSVIHEDGLFTMIYGNVFSSVSGFGLATSVDGKNWVKQNSNPIFTKERTHNHWAYQEVSFPFIRKFGNEIRVYYTGYYSDISAIGMIRKVQ